MTLLGTQQGRAAPSTTNNPNSNPNPFKQQTINYRNTNSYLLWTHTLPPLTIHHTYPGKQKSNTKQTLNTLSIRRPVLFRHCVNQQCPLHGRMIILTQVRSKISRRTYITRDNANCNTQYVIYLIQCNHCGKQYVGQTGQSLKNGIKKHLNAIRDRHRPSALQEHFRRTECYYINNLSIQVLHVLTPHTNETPKSIENKLKSLELLWIDRGLNWARYDPASRHQYYQLNT